MDDPRPARDRLQAPAPLALEARAGHTQAEARLGSSLEALDLRRVAQQAEAGPGRSGSWRPPARTARPGRAAAPGRGPRSAAGSWSVAQTVRGDAWTNTRRSTSRSAAGVAGTAASRPPGPGRTAMVCRRSGARPSSSRGRRRSIRDARTARSSSQSKRASATRRRSAREALDVVGGELLGLECASRRGRPTCRGRRRRRGRRGPARAPRLKPGQDVDDAARHVGRGEDLGQGDGRQRAASRDAMSTTALPVTSGGASRDDEAEQRRGLRGDDADDAGRLGDREVEVRRGDRVRRAEDLGDLVRPAGVPDPAVDGAVDDLARRRPRRPSAAATSATNWSRRPSISSATRYRTWPRFIAVLAAQPSERLARGADGVAEVLARGPAGVGERRRRRRRETRYERPISVRGNAPPMYSL